MSGLLATLPQGLRAADSPVDKPVIKDPPPSLIVNNGKDTWAIRISDDALPVGVVKFYEADDVDLQHPTPKQSKDDTYILKPGAQVKMAICGSALEPGNPVVKAAFSQVPDGVKAKLKYKLVALYISLDKLDSSQNVAVKSASRYHFVHGVLPSDTQVGAATMLADCASLNLPSAVTKLLDKSLSPVSKAQKGIWPMNKDTWDTTSEGQATIQTNPDNYQKADSGPFWIILK